MLSTAAHTFEWGEAMQALVAVDGPTALVVSDGDDHRRRRRLVQPAFSIKRVDAHLGLVVTEVDRALAAWQPGAQLDASASLRDAVRRIVVRALFGEQLGADADRFGALLEPGLRYVQRMPQRRFEHDLRVNPYARVQRSNRAADELVLAEVARRRAAGIDADAHPDTLTALLAGVDGEALSDAELLDQVRSLMAAGFDTTSGAASWLVLELGRNPEALAAVRAEVDAVLGDRAPTTDDLRAPAPHPRRRPGGAAHVAARPRRPPDVDRAERAARDGDPGRPAGALQRLRHRTHAGAVARPGAVRSRPAGRPARPSRCRTRSCPSAAAPGAASASPSPPSSCR